MTQHAPIPAGHVLSHVRTLPAVRQAEPRGLLVRLRRAGRAALVAIARAHTERATARALERLSARQLRDIGIDRGAIPEAARAAAWAQLTVAGLDHPSGSATERGHRGL